MNANERKIIIDKHVAWRNGEPGGERADLSGAYLRGAKGILSIGSGGSRGDMLYAVKHETCVMIKAGCFWGTLDEFHVAVEKTHGDNEHGRYYRAVIELVKTWEKG